ncbi:MAG: metalloregulator ArsR/SmtB family transcription factor [Ilumatobacteraceae bacterium]
MSTPTRKNLSAEKSVVSCCLPVTQAPLSGRDAKGLAECFAALSDPVRLKLFSLIAAAGTSETCACSLVKPIGRSQPTVSHHLKVLREAGLITSIKRGIWVWYRADPQRLAELQSILG